MKGHYSTHFNPRDLSSRLTRIKKTHSAPNDGDAVSRLPRLPSGSGARAPSFMPTNNDNNDDMDLTHLPVFTKSSTMSTTSTSESHESSDSKVSRLEVRGVHTFPLATCTSSENVEVGQGGFSKPGVRRRGSSRSENAGEFRYYGRHANSWLFNDFSITDTVRRGFGKVFSGKEGHG
ncbi:hypothetical protein P280DRAFT_467735 [Massarina eburnea CBS 473.64]|uniref:Uncharacterized protein n=1 Tax=Massarina eburnea CBS 473.64 TaxID=1395130 RepID=A0A6A6S7I0_9PLEO|nr:hypothetical protein P280DRAFT_467735 [Massarina eburnea CBS 473.64]